MVDKALKENGHLQGYHTHTHIIQESEMTLFKYLKQNKEFKKMTCLWNTANRKLKNSTS
jgi:hypothetical protein